MRKFLIGWFVNFLSLWLIDNTMSGISFSGAEAMAFASLVLVLLNATLKPILKVLSLPVTILSFGIFSLFINAIILVIALSVSPGCYLDGFGSAFLASILLTIFNTLLNWIIGE